MDVEGRRRRPTHSGSITKVPTMETDHWIAAGLALAISGGLAASEAHRVWLRRREVLAADVLIGSAMDRVGVTPGDAVLAGFEEELPRATGRCRECAVTDECRARLAGVVQRGLPEDCPNARLFAAIAADTAVLEGRCGQAQALEQLEASLTLARRVP